MTFSEKLRDRMRSYFNPPQLDPVGFRNAVQSGLTGIGLAELTVYILLQQSARLGEIPTYTTDVVVMGIAALEFFLGPFLGWLGFHRRRNVMIMWFTIAMVCTLPVFGTPSPDTKPDTALCTIQNHFLPSGMTMRLAIRLSILLLAALACALGRVAVTAHALAYLDEDQPSFNTHMNLAGFLLVRVVLLHLGAIVLRTRVEGTPWFQTILIVVNFFTALLQLFRYPVMPTVDTSHNGERSLFRSLGRVLRTKMVLLNILAMGLLGAAVWGYGSHEAGVAKVKFHIVAGRGGPWQLTGVVRSLLVIFAVVLSGYLYTAPVMPVYEKYRALSRAALMTVFGIMVLIIMMTLASCSKVPLAGMGETAYSQPACGLQCGCDRPWTSFSPVCDSQGMTTYFSPCHAGCSTAETTNNVRFYANCTCAGGGRATEGACADGACGAAHTLHTLLLTCLTFCAALALTWHGTVMLESADRRDKSVAVGLASGTVSLFTFVGGHALYMWISDYTCASFERHRCLLHSPRFASLVGFTTIGLVSASLAITIVAAVILNRQKKNHQVENTVPDGHSSEVYNQY